MNKLLIAALLGTAPAIAFAQAASADTTGEPRSKIITVVRSDVAPAQSEAPHTIGTIKARSARVGEKTVSLVEGSLPERGAPARSSGS
ncbi:MAG: hypothetical protein JWR77_1368 [Rhizorhabdus sp.]|nr:hypothetical protein [Rhizorhabdus sp.]